MALIFTTRKTSQPPVKPINRGHSKALPVNISLDQPGRLRVGHLMNLFSVSHATLYSRIKNGLIPKCDGKDGGRPFWKTETIKQALEQ